MFVLPILLVWGCSGPTAAGTFGNSVPPTIPRTQDRSKPVPSSGKPKLVSKKSTTRMIEETKAFMLEIAKEEEARRSLSLFSQPQGRTVSDVVRGTGGRAEFESTELATAKEAEPSTTDAQSKLSAVRRAVANLPSAALGSRFCGRDLVSEGARRSRAPPN